MLFIIYEIDHILYAFMKCVEHVIEGRFSNVILHKSKK